MLPEGGIRQYCIHYYGLAIFLQIHMGHYSRCHYVSVSEHIEAERAWEGPKYNSPPGHLLECSHQAVDWNHGESGGGSVKFRCLFDVLFARVNEAFTRFIEDKRSLGQIELLEFCQLAFIDFDVFIQ